MQIFQGYCRPLTTTLNTVVFTIEIHKLTFVYTYTYTFIPF